MTKFLNISTDNTLGGNSSSNEVVSAQKAVKDYVDGGLSSKQDTISDLSTIRSGASAGATAVQPADLATVATTGDYDDLLNKPTIPAAQVQSDWTQADNTKVDFIKNKPSLATVATSGSYTDLSNKPTNLVTTDTAQTITGLKTLEHTTTTDVSVVGLTVKGDHLQKGVNPSSNRFNSIEFTDINDANICKFSAIQTSDGWTGFLAGAGSDPTAPSNNLLMIASGSNKLLLIPATSSHQYSAVRRDFFNNNAVKHTPSTAVGSSTRPVYVASDGTATVCSLATVASTGAYSDLTGTPTLATVATSGLYSDLSGTPTIPTVNNATLTITQGGVSKGTFTANASSDVTIDLDAGASVDWGDIGGTLADQTDLNTALGDKANTDADNFTATGKSTIAEYAMPSDSYVALTPVADGQLLVQAPANGYVYVEGTSAGAGWCVVGLTVTVSTGTSASDGKKLQSLCWEAAGAGNGMSAFVPVKKGDKVWQIAYAFATSIARFIYAEGEI